MVWLTSTVNNAITLAPWILTYTTFIICETIYAIIGSISLKSFDCHVFYGRFMWNYRFVSLFTLSYSVLTEAQNTRFHFPLLWSSYFSIGIFDPTLPLKWNSWFFRSHGQLQPNIIHIRAVTKAEHISHLNLPGTHYISDSCLAIQCILCIIWITWPCYKGAPLCHHV